MPSIQWNAWFDFAVIVRALQLAGWRPVYADENYGLMFLHSTGRRVLVPFPETINHL